MFEYNENYIEKFIYFKIACDRGEGGGKNNPKKSIAHGLKIFENLFPQSSK